MRNAAELKRRKPASTRHNQTQRGAAGTGGEADTSMHPPKIRVLSALKLVFHCSYFAGRDLSGTVFLGRPDGLGSPSHIQPTR